MYVELANNNHRDKEDEMMRKTYQVVYQLGARGVEVTTKRDAARELAQSINAALDGGDDQDIWVEDDDGTIYRHPYDHTTGRYNRRTIIAD